MEVSAEKSKIMVNSADNIMADITMNGEHLEQVDQFKYLGSTISADGRSTKEVKVRLAMAMSTVTSLGIIWKNRNISFCSKMKLYKSLVLSVLLYGCESWTLNADLERRIQAFETKCYRRLLRISWFERRTNEYVLNLVETLAGPQERLLSIVKRRKLQWFGHATRHNTLSKTILQGTLEGGRARGRPRRSWVDDIKSWTELGMPQLLSEAEDRTRWRRLSSTASLTSPPRPNGSRD